MAIRYGKDGDIEIYDEKTGKTTGHISTMGNMIEETEELLKARKERWDKALKAHGVEYRE
ncbi:MULTISPECIES: hypothetical protein [unclassified Treponema]|uniref:hypothetical protein n=1 Tax=unclassified Treponema TaxID=2638727 RepID=UPI0020A30263|nr:MULTISPECIES: hypothetical protein [unclassified Treponema]UTC66014.1 hypothetical protein E4O06_08255 [Treponema sp. OMZ 789]UTC68744.1 hypothetical protein E4O01_08395 [Treponema sp. OMZ 790]UTC71473.1 hypothetical protein E4O02_08585 [Treponema sp. OMZ 791]